MLPVVIPVRVSPVNHPLNLTLHQLERHHPATVYLVGHLPEITTTLDVVHIPTMQGADRFANTELAMRTALDEIPDPFVWSADDQFWVKPHGPVDWHQGPLPTEGRGRYTTRKIWTRRILEHHGLPTLDYELHTPMLIRKNLMRQALDIGGSMRSVYGNLQGTGTYHADVKVYPGRPVPDGPFLSSHRRTYTRVAEYLTRASAPASTPEQALSETAQ